MTILPDKRRTKWSILYACIAAVAGAALLFFMPHGKLIVSSEPSGAHVYLDGKDFGTTPRTIELRRGRYKVEIISEGYVPIQQTIAVDSLKTTSTHMHLMRTEK